MPKDLRVRLSVDRPHMAYTDKRNDKTGDFEILPVDPFPYSAGLVNPCGFNMNDIYAYENAASDSVADSILHRINTLPATDVNKDVSLDDKIAMCVPRGWSSPAEYSRYCEKVATRLYQQQQLKSESDKSDDTIQFDKKDETVTD